MKKRTPFLFTPSPDDMYAEDKVATDPPTTSTRKGTGKTVKGGESDSERDEHRRKEKLLKDRIHSLEQEVIKLQLKLQHTNSRVIASAPGPGQFRCLDLDLFSQHLWEQTYKSNFLFHPRLLMLPRPLC